MTLWQKYSERTWGLECQKTGNGGSKDHWCLQFSWFTNKRLVLWTLRIKPEGRQSEHLVGLGLTHWTPSGERNIEWTPFDEKTGWTLERDAGTRFLSEPHPYKSGSWSPVSQLQEMKEQRGSAKGWILGNISRYRAKEGYISIDETKKSVSVEKETKIMQ